MHIIRSHFDSRSSRRLFCTVCPRIARNGWGPCVDGSRSHLVDRGSCGSRSESHSCCHRPKPNSPGRPYVRPRRKHSNRSWLGRPRPFEAKIQRHVSGIACTGTIRPVDTSQAGFSMQPKARATWSWLMALAETRAPTPSIFSWWPSWRQASTMPNSQKSSTRLLCIAKSCPFHRVEHCSCH